MKKTRIHSFAAIVLLSLILSACGSAVGASSWPGITVDQENNAIYVAYNQHVYALDAETGRESWRFPAESDNGVSFYAAPELSTDGQLLIAGYDQQIYSLDPQANGRLNWQFISAGNRYIGSPAADDAGIYAPNSDRSIYALSSDGQLNWTFETQDAQWAAPVSDGERIYLPSLDHNVYALNSLNGDLKWQQDLEAGIVGRPALDDAGRIFVGTFGSEVVALNSANGVIQWRSNTEGWIWGGPSYFEGNIYVSDIEGYVYAFDAERGQEIWRVSTNGAITGTPLVANDHVYVSTENGQVMSIGIDGVIQWTQTVEGQAFSSPALSGDLILIGLVEGEAILLAMDFNGNTVWSFTPQN
jgi:outer membrane protein assembly factor BamB